MWKNCIPMVICHRYVLGFLSAAFQKWLFLIMNDKYLKKWGEGPVQGKIYGGPGYIEENFPRTDKFIHCKVERLNTAKEVHVLHKGDEGADEEEFHQARAQMEANNDFSQVRGGAGLQLAGSDNVLVFGGFFVGIMMMALLTMKNRKKVVSKSN